MLTHRHVIVMMFLDWPPSKTTSG